MFLHIICVLLLAFCRCQRGNVFPVGLSFKDAMSCTTISSASTPHSQGRLPAGGAGISATAMTGTISFTSMFGGTNSATWRTGASGGDPMMWWRMIMHIFSHHPTHDCSQCASLSCPRVHPHPVGFSASKSFPRQPPQPQPENFGHLRPELVAKRSRRRVRYPSNDEDLRFVEWPDLLRYHPTPLGRPFPEVLDTTDEIDPDSTSAGFLSCTEDESSSPHRVFEEPPAPPGGPARSTSAAAAIVSVAAPLSGTVVCNARPEQVPPPPTSTVGYSVEQHSGEEPALPNSPSVCTCDQPHKLLGRGSRDDLLEAELMAMFSMGSDSPARMPPPDVPDKAPVEPRSPWFNWRASMGRPYVRMLSMAEARCHRQRPGTRKGLRPRRIHRNTGRLMRTSPGTRAITEDGSGHKCPIRSWRLLITWDRLEPLWLDFSLAQMLPDWNHFPGESKTRG